MELARFVVALHRIEPTGGPPGVRGVDTAAVTAAWEHDLHAPAWTGPPVWVHGDLSPGFPPAG